MADYPAPQSIATGAPSGSISAAILAYALFGVTAITGFVSQGMPWLTPLVGLVGIAGLIICYVKRGDAPGAWVESHFTWLIRTFWWSLFWSLVGFLILFTLGLILIGIPIAILIFFVVDVWVVYRLIRGYLAFRESRPLPV